MGEAGTLAGRRHRAGVEHLVAGGHGLLADDPEDDVTGSHYSGVVALSPTAYRFTVKDYHRMAEADILPEGDVADASSSPRTKRRFTVEEFRRMDEAGIFDPEARVELLDGEVIEMSPIGTRHAGCVNRLIYHFVTRLGARAVVAPQNPIQIGNFSQPQPDVVVLRPRPDFYGDQHALPPDVLLAVEVADTSLRFDLRRKAPLYTAGGLPEVWVVDVAGGVVHVFRAGAHTEHRAGDSLAPLAFPDLVLEVTAILG